MHPRVLSMVSRRPVSEGCICNFEPKELLVDVTIIGTGNMARGIATRVLAGGHSVTLLGTSTDKAEALAAELDGDVRAGKTGDALAGDVIVLAVWYQAVDAVLATYGDQLAGKVVVDITNPVDPETYAPLAVEEGSVAHHIAARVPDAKVVKAFNTTFAGTLVEGTVAGQPLDVFLAGDDQTAKDTVKQLARDGGLRAIDVGPLALAHHIEALGYLNMAIQPALGTNYASAIKVLA